MAENQNIEWKESWRDEYLKWICGFANAQGGKIYIGVNDSGKVIGVKNIHKLLEDIPNKIVSALGIIADVNNLSEDGKDYLEIIVEPNPYPVSYKGEYHFRSGSTKQQLVGSALNQFLLKKTGITWDSVPIDGVKVSDFRNDGFDVFREQAVKNKRMMPEDVEVNNEQLVDDLNLLSNGYLTRAAILLFHQKPEKWIPGSFVKIAYFSSDADIEYQDEVHGPLIAQAELVVNLIFLKYLKATISYDGITRVESYPYPRAAIREAVLNAIAHKDYSTLTPVQIRIYDDKIMIANDCVFPTDWTAESLMEPHKSRPHNPLIANAFFRAGLIESWGRGIEKMTESCLLLGTPAPEYLVHNEDITLTLRALNVPQDVPQDVPQNVPRDISAKREEIILNMVKENPHVTQEQIAEYLQVSTKTVKRCMSKMDSIQYVGTGSNGKWEITG